MGTVKSAEPRQYAIFYRNRSNRSRNITIFGFFQTATAVILDFKIFKFLTVGHAKEVELCHLAKFRRNRLNCARDMAIFRFFKMAAAAILDFSKFQNFNGGDGQEGRTTSPYQISLKSAQPRPRYRDLSIFQDGGRRHLGF